MSYIAFDLDALNVCPQVGAAVGNLSAADASHGLLQMWAYCFRFEVTELTDIHLRGFFLGRDAGPALAVFGFLEQMDGGWRVRGAERYLRIKNAQREGGKKGRAASSSTVGKPKKTQPGTLKSTSGSTLRSTSGSTSGSQQALTPTTDDRRPNTESKSVAPGGAPDPRHAPLVRALTETYVRLRKPPDGKYPWDGRDGRAVTSLLAKGIEPTVVAAFARALGSDKYPVVRAIWELDAHFAHFVGASAGEKSTAPPQYAEGSVRL